MLSPALYSRSKHRANGLMTSGRMCQNDATPCFGVHRYIYTHIHIYACQCVCIFIHLQSVRIQVLSQDLNLAHTVLTLQVGSGKQSPPMRYPILYFARRIARNIPPTLQGHLLSRSSQASGDAHPSKSLLGRQTQSLRVLSIWGFPKIGGPFLGVPLNGCCSKFKYRCSSIRFPCARPCASLRTWGFGHIPPNAALVLLLKAEV